MAVSRAVVVDHALAYAHRSIANPPPHFAPVDLIIRLLDLLQAVRQESVAAPDRDSDDDAVDRIVLGLGNVLFSDELGL
jgi:hypothetical protein